MTKIKIAKFGGSLIEGASDFIAVKNVIQNNQFDVVVISATKGTTNLLEKLAMSIYQGRDVEAKELVHQFQERHELLINELNLPSSAQEKLKLLTDQLREFLSISIPLLIGEDFDAILSFGERTSSLILSELLESYDLFDITSVIRTDSEFSNANVDFKITNQLVLESLGSQIESGKSFITQGFLGKNENCNITTLGREGSDYTASILAGALSAEDVTIFTDVAGVFESDPKTFPSVKVIPSLSYEQAEAMAEQGAKVLYPKTLLPIKERKIPLVVTNLTQKSETRISSDTKEISFAFIQMKNRLSLFLPAQFRAEALSRLNGLNIVEHEHGIFVELINNTTTEIILDKLNNLINVGSVDQK